MVVRMKTTPSKETPAQATADPLRGVQAGGVEKEQGSTEVEFSRLKNLVPSISRKTTVSKLDVILEAIRYIDQLQDQLLDQIAEKRLNPQLAADLLVGKENTNTDVLSKLQEERKSSRHQH